MSSQAKTSSEIEATTGLFFSIDFFAMVPAKKEGFRKFTVFYSVPSMFNENYNKKEKSILTFLKVFRRLGNFLLERRKV